MNKINQLAKQNQRHGNMEQTDSGQRQVGRRAWWNEGEGISQRTCMNDPWIWTIVWDRLWEWGWGGARWRRAKGEKLGQLQQNKQINKNKKLSV